MGNGVKAWSPESQNALISLFQNLKTEVAGDFSPWQNSSKALGKSIQFRVSLLVDEHRRDWRVGHVRWVSWIIKGPFIVEWCPDRPMPQPGNSLLGALDGEEGAPERCWWPLPSRCQAGCPRRHQRQQGQVEGTRVSTQQPLRASPWTPRLCFT